MLLQFHHKGSQLFMITLIHVILLQETQGENHFEHWERFIRNECKSYKAGVGISKY